MYKNILNIQSTTAQFNIWKKMKTSQCRVKCYSCQKFYLGEVLEVVELLVEEALDEASFPEAKNNKLV